VLNEMWEREVDFLIEYFRKKKKDKQVIKIKGRKGKVNIVKNIEKIQEDQELDKVKEEVVRIYMLRQKGYYTLRFLYWLAIYRGE
jgi:RIO-like serine/threonine protein kinase